MREFPVLRDYYSKHWWVIILLPFFNFVVFFIRLAGIINSIGTDSSWKTRNLSEEGKAFMDVVKDDFSKPLGLFRKFRELVNYQEAE